MIIDSFFVLHLKLLITNNITVWSKIAVINGVLINTDVANMPLFCVHLKCSKSLKKQNIARR